MVSCDDIWFFYLIFIGTAIIFLFRYSMGRHNYGQVHFFFYFNFDSVFFYAVQTTIGYILFRQVYFDRLQIEYIHIFRKVLPHSLRFISIKTRISPYCIIISKLYFIHVRLNYLNILKYCHTLKLRGVVFYLYKKN